MTEEIWGCQQLLRDAETRDTAKQPKDTGQSYTQKYPAQNVNSANVINLEFQTCFLSTMGFSYY